ncbi:MAG: DNA polymerase III subunit beta [Patescibacteria group bacterium]|nr:DNA polymerase III subunit beta [Patescibacteria group bacterium]
MKLIALKNNLKSGLDYLSRVISSNPNLPVLSNVLIKASDGEIKLLATNLETAITAKVPGKVTEDGGLSVPYGIFSGMINNLSTERISLESVKNNLEVKTDNYEANIQGLGEEEFPIFPKIRKENNFLEINSTVLNENLKKVVIAAEMSEIRPEISGVLLVAEIDQIKLVATNSFRLAEAIIKKPQFQNNFNQGVKAIIPLKTAEEITRIIKDDQSTKIYLDDSQILVETGDVEIISRLIEGTYPDYEAIIPKNIESQAVMNKGELINALKLASVFAAKGNDIRMKNKDAKYVEIYSGSSNLGENNYSIPAEIAGEFRIGFNWRFLLDGVRAASGERVIIKLSGQGKPAIIGSPEDKQYSYILAPLKGGE